jgi:hypothetical protein
MKALKRSVSFFSIMILVASIMVFSGIAEAKDIVEFWTDGIVEAGQVRRLSFHMKLVDDFENATWHYFGSTAAEFPPTSADPVTEYAYIQFPTDFDELGEEANGTLYDLALIAGLQRQQLQDIGIDEFWTDELETSGVTKKMSFRVKSQDVWYYFGSSVAAFPCPSTCNEVADIQFPRDFDLLDEVDPFLLYEIALQAALNREGLE